MPKVVKLDKKIKPVKGRMSALFFYSRAIRREAAAKGIKVLPTDALKEAARTWSSLSSYNQEKYKMLANMDGIRFHSERTGMILTRVVGKRGPTLQLKRLPRNPHLPRKQPSPFFIYLKEKSAALRDEQPHLKQPQIVKELSRRWKLLSDEEKAEFKLKTHEANLQYREKMKEYKKLARTGGMVVDTTDEDGNEVNEDMRANINTNKDRDNQTPNLDA